MLQSMVITKDLKPTKEQLDRINEAAKYPVVPDEECPEVLKDTKGYKRVPVKNRNFA